MIRSNLVSQASQFQLRQTNNGVKTAIERLSSGLRINSAKDDAAGQAISNRMTSQIKGQHQAARNANDGVSIAQTAHGALGSINDKLQRIRELTVQGLNGTLQLQDSDAVQAEINLNLKEIGRLSKSANFNGIPLLNGTAGNIDLQVGANDNETLGINLSRPGFSVDELGLTDFTVVGLDGKVSPRNTLPGTARDVFLDDPATTINWHSSLESGPLFRDNRGNYYAQNTDGDNFSRVSVSSEHKTSVDNSTVNINNPRALHRDTLVAPSTRQSDLIGLSPNESLIKQGDTYYVKKTASDGNLEYREAEFSLRFERANGSRRVTVSGSGPVETFPNAKGTADEFSAAPKANAPLVNFTSFGDIKSNPGTADFSTIGTRKLVQDPTNPNLWAIRGKASDGDGYSFFEANLDIKVNAQGQATAVAATATGAPPTILGIKSHEQEKVASSSEVTIDTRNVTVKYTDAEGRDFEDVLRKISEDEYFFDLPGGNSQNGGFKTASLIDLVGKNQTLIRTVNGTGDVVIYYPFEHSAVTDANGFDNSNNVPGTAHTRLHITENGNGIRLRVPSDPLAALDRAIAMVDDKRSHLGAVENRLGSAIDTLATSSYDLTAARSRIQDADYAVEVANNARHGILQQASGAMLTQANQMSKQVLSLLDA